MSSLRTAHSGRRLPCWRAGARRGLRSKEATARAATGRDSLRSRQG